MKKSKSEVLANLCFSDLVYDRINKKLGARMSRRESREIIYKALKQTQEKCFRQTGKNIYVLSPEHNLRITINSNTCRVIIVDRIRELRLMR